MTEYELKIWDKLQKVTFIQIISVDNPSLADAFPLILERVEQLNTRDRRPAGTYDLKGVKFAKEKRRW